ncbi:MAG: RimK/LysX family protein [Chitinophagales bacterium]|nr:RimK/LysX family protein [Chitinophagales bacterium]
MKETKITIGRIDKVDFPELGMADVEAKIDSGAFTSSIHCGNINAFYKGDDHYVRFVLFDDQQVIKHEARVFASKQVKNSFGQIEYRYTIKTEVVVFDKAFEIELALTNRSSMKYPVLLGRKLLSDLFIVDVTKLNLSFKEKQKNLKLLKK